MCIKPLYTIADGLKKLREEYLSGNEATKKFLEKRYGKVTIQQALEESFSNEWLQKFSKQCPGCGFNIQVCYRGVEIVKFSTCPRTSKWP